MSRRSSNNSVLDGLKAFQATYGMTKGIMDQQGAADAYREGAAVSENTATTGGERTEQAAPTDANYVQNPEYTGEAGQDKYIYSGDAAAAGAAPGLQAQYSAPTDTATQTVSYGLGGKTYDTAPTENMRSAAGLSGAGKYYASTGNLEEAARLGRLAQQVRQSDGQEELAGLNLASARRGERQAALTEDQRMKLDADIAEIRANPAKQAELMKRAYNGNVGRFGEGEHKDVQLDYELSPEGGGRVWQKDASGKAIGQPQQFTAAQLEGIAVDTHWRTTDPIGYAKAAAAVTAKAAARREAVADANTAEDYRQKNRIALEGVKKDSRLEVNAARPTAGGKAGLSTAEERNFNFYVKQGMSEAEALQRVTTRKSAGETYSVTSKADPLGGAPIETTKRSGPGAGPSADPVPPGVPSGSKKIGTSGGKPVYQSPDGKRFLVD